MGQLLEYLFEKKDDFKGNPKELDKLIKKIESCSHAPTTDKHAQRMNLTMMKMVGKIMTLSLRGIYSHC